MRLEGKVAVITGAGRGIAKGIAELFATEGAAVVVDDVVDEKGLEVVAGIEAAGGKAIYVNCDVSQKGQVKGMFDEAERTFGKVDVLVNSAIPGPDEILDDGWRTVEVSFRGTYLCTLEAIERMKKVGGGSVISLSSVNAFAAFGDVPIYAGVKAAIIGMMRTFAVSQGKHQIRFNAICPGSIVTEAWSRLLKKEPEIFERIAKLYPMGKLGEPIDVAYAAVYLASDESRFSTGSVFVIDGGLTAGIQDFHGEEEVEGKTKNC